MGFESSRVARRRLASLAATNERVLEALSPASFPGLTAGEPGLYPALVAETPADMIDRTGRPAHHVADVSSVSATNGPTAQALVMELDELAQDIVSTPGAGGALLAAYAAQARALTMVLEASRRSTNGALPAAVLLAAQAALVPPAQLSGLALL